MTSTLELEQELDALEAESARRSLREFAKKFWHVVEPAEQLRWNWHLDVLCDVLEMCARGELTKVIINVPPGTMKTLLVNVMFPAWVWATFPSKRFLTASHSFERSLDANVKLRQIVSSALYKEQYDVELAGDQNAKERFDTTDGGWRIATSVGGPGVGMHPDFIIVDDPLTPLKARSKVERDTVNHWVTKTLSTRGIMRRVCTIVIMQRLHQDDPSGHLLARGGWEHVMLPMRYERARRNPYDMRGREGELLWPSLLPDDKVRAVEKLLGAYDTAGQLQQRPAPQGGGLFKRSWFKIIEPEVAAAMMGRECRGWDTAATEGAGDWTVGVKLKQAAEKFIFMNVVRGQFGPSEQKAVIKTTAIMDGRFCKVREEQEPGSAGKVVIASRAQDLVGYDYGGVPLSGDKEVRAGPLRAQAEAGNVYIVRAPWNEAFLEELELFPNGTNDDQVDGASCSFNALTLGPKPIEILDVAWG